MDDATPDVDAAHHSPRILIVDESQENREVLRTLLQRRGLQVVDAARADDGLALARDCHPAVIVLDLDARRAEEADVQAGYAQEAADDHASIVLLGRARQFRSALPGDQVLSKPYHYGRLLRTIERLVERVDVDASHERRSSRDAA